jgi:hypothetical protein
MPLQPSEFTPGGVLCIVFPNAAAGVDSPPPPPVLLCRGLRMGGSHCRNGPVVSQRGPDWFQSKSHVWEGPSYTKVDSSSSQTENARWGTKGQFPDGSMPHEDE